MQSEIMFAGFGGQGIMISAKILAHGETKNDTLEYRGYKGGS